MRARFRPFLASPVVLASLLAGAVLAASVPDLAAQDAPKEPPAAARSAEETRRKLAEYRLTVGDEIQVVVHQPGSLTPVISLTFTVPANGVVSLPPIGKIELQGRTSEEIEVVVAQRLKDENYLTAPNVSCIVVTYTPRYVSVLGAVRKKVALPIHRDMRILELLAELGELDSEGADFSRVLIRRMGPDDRAFWFPVDVDAVFKGSDEQQNVVLKAGDIVQIPRLESVTSPTASDFVYVLGKVATRGRIPMVRGGRPFTLLRLIAICGDFTEFANRSSVRVIRQTETGPRMFEIDVDDVLKLKTPDFELKPDDVVFVPESMF